MKPHESRATLPAPQDGAGPYPAAPDVYELRLYVAGQTPKSVAAFNNLKRLCDEHLPGRYRVEVVDLLVNPRLAKGEQIIAAPTLLKKQPLPPRRLVGNLAPTDQVLAGLDIHREG